MGETVVSIAEQFQPIPVRLDSSSLSGGLTLALNLGSKDDPLGYSIVATKR